MDRLDITIRDAREDDAAFLGEVVLAAAHLTDFSATAAGTDFAAAARMSALADICRRSDTLYSWRNARIACVAGRRAGAAVSYPGEIYAAARAVTFPLFPDVSQADIDATDIEVLPGEWYLDSLAVLPEFRKEGLGKMLVMDAIERARASGYPRCSLFAEKSSTHLVAYYTRLGFNIESGKMYFGNEYWRMVLSL